MKLRFPLYTKILLWFFLNLAVLAAVFYAFFRIQFRVGLDSLLLGPSGARLDAVGHVIVDELSSAQRETWSSILTRFGTAYGVQFALFTPNGRQQAGEKLVLPEAVMTRLREQPREPRPRMQGPGPGRSPQGPDELPPEPPPGTPLNPGGPGGPGMAGEPPMPPSSVAFQKFMERTVHPTQYWVGMRVPMRPLDRVRQAPLVLIAVSPSLSGGGLFVDLTPWYVVGASVVVLSALIWFPVIRGITRTVSQVTQATERMAEGNFEAQLSVQRADELGRLAHAVNQLGARLNGFVTGQKRFLGDISHELCSPLARAEMALSVLEQKAATDQQQYIEDVREEVRLMSNLVNELLSFSKAGLKPKDLELTPVPLRPLVERVLAREAVEPGDVQVEIPADLHVAAEPELLARAVGNLVRNARRYAGHAGPITVSATSDANHALLTVSDVGPGVPEPDLVRLGEPFYRPDTARARESGGVGLGLAIVRACIDACRGTLTLRNRSPRGFEASIRLETTAERI